MTCGRLVNRRVEGSTGRGKIKISHLKSQNNIISFLWLDWQLHKPDTYLNDFRFLRKSNSKLYFTQNFSPITGKFCRKGRRREQDDREISR